jgi:hypothetical protein
MCGRTLGTANYDSLIDAAPEAAWTTAEDPKYEWLDQWVAYSPATGPADAFNPNANGEQVVTANELWATLEQLTDDGMVRFNRRHRGRRVQPGNHGAPRLRQQSRAQRIDRGDGRPAAARVFDVIIKTAGNAPRNRGKYVSGAQI